MYLSNVQLKSNPFINRVINVNSNPTRKLKRFSPDLELQYRLDLGAAWCVVVQGLLDDHIGGLAQTQLIY